jgi:hypothetical protein
VVEYYMEPIITFRMVRSRSEFLVPYPIAMCLAFKVCVSVGPTPVPKLDTLTHKAADGEYGTLLE